VRRRESDDAKVTLKKAIAEGGTGGRKGLQHVRWTLDRASFSQQCDGSEMRRIERTNIKFDGEPLVLLESSEYGEGLSVVGGGAANGQPGEGKK